jgi:hypothetical protein
VIVCSDKELDLGGIVAHRNNERNENFLKQFKKEDEKAP